jgi:uncharacterized protein (TIGR03437 family)
LQVVASAQTPGTYYGGITVTWDGGAITVPLVLSVTAIPGAPPLMATVTNAASQTAGCIAPGELITVFGAGIGGTPSLWTLDSAGRMPNVVGGSQVVINGVPSPMIYASANQINAIVPYEAGTRDLASVHVTVNGQESAPWAVPLAPSAPGIFTIESDGVGQAAVLNQDSSVNGASNPAVRGTIIQIFATGEGQDSPGNVTGEITPLGGNTTVLPVTVTVGGLGAQVIYHGSSSNGARSRRADHGQGGTQAVSCGGHDRGSVEEIPRRQAGLLASLRKRSSWPHSCCASATRCSHRSAPAGESGPDSPTNTAWLRINPSAPRVAKLDVP